MYEQSLKAAGAIPGKYLSVAAGEYLSGWALLLSFTRRRNFAPLPSAGLVLGWTCPHAGSVDRTVFEGLYGNIEAGIGAASW